LTMEELRRPSNESDHKPAAPDVKAPEDESKTSKDKGKSSKQENKDDGNSSKQEKKSENKALSNESSLMEARAALDNQRAKLPELAAAISAAENRLARLLGTYAADIDGAIRGPAKLPTLPQRLRPGMPIDLLRRRPDIREAERELAAATERIGVATADLFPSVALTAGFGGQGTVGRFGAQPPPLHGPIWSVGPRAYWPLLDFGRLDAIINIEEMRTHENLVRYKKTIIGAVDEVDQAIRQYHLELQRWKALGAAQAELRRNIDLTAERYTRDEATVRDVIDVQRRYYVLSEQTATAEEAAVLRYVAFYKALGGGWELYADLPPLPATQPAVVASVRRWKGGWR
jgi:outer membrane protein TolC